MKLYFLKLLMFLSTSSFAHTLEGLWSSDCNPFGRHAIIANIEFGKNDFIALGNLYEKLGCGIKTVNAEFKGNYIIGDFFGEGVEFNFIPDTFTLTLLKSDVVDHYNKNKICNFDDWELNSPKDILGQSNCVGFVPQEKGVEIYDLFKINSQEDLRFSIFPLGNFVVDVNHRPTTIDFDSTRFWKASDKNFNRVKRDLKIYDEHINEKQNEFAKIPSNISDKKWVKQKLKFMVEIDQYMRNYKNTPHIFKYSKSENDYFVKEFGFRFVDMDKANTSDLKKLLEIYGWFNISDFGNDADRDGWLLVQHADLDHNFQRQVLETLSKYWKVGETSPQNYAYLYDRVAASFNDPSKRVPQRYGTQGSCVGPGKWEPIEIEDPQSVDKRRKEVGLEPLQNYMDNFKVICK